MPKIVTLKLPSSFLRKIDSKLSAKGSSLARNSLKKADVGSSPAPGTPQSHTGGARSMAAVNASLRALDKSGKPCRRWVKDQINIKSFTGVEYTLVSWKGASLESKESPLTLSLETTTDGAAEEEFNEAVDSTLVEASEDQMVKSEAE